MQHFSLRKRRPPPGSRPGQLALSADAPPRRIHVIDYTPERIEELDVTDVDELARFRGTESVTWIEVEGLGDEAGLHRLGELFAIHPLALADAVNAPQRPKAEAYEGHELVICAMVRLGDDETCHLEQVSFVIGAGFVISFQEGLEDVFDPVRARLRNGGPGRSVGADFLAYALIDTLIDGYYPVLEAIGEELEELEAVVVSRPVPETLAAIHTSRRLIQVLARTMRQQRDAVNTLVRGESPRISEPVRVYLRDAFDHALQLNELLETYRELAISLDGGLPLERQQPHERGDAGADDHLDDLHPAVIPGGRLRHELQVHARALHALGLPRALGADDRRRGLDVVLLPAAGLGGRQGRAGPRRARRIAGALRAALPEARQRGIPASHESAPEFRQRRRAARCRLVKRVRSK